MECPTSLAYEWIMFQMDFDGVKFILIGYMCPFFTTLEEIVFEDAKKN